MPVQMLNHYAIRTFDIGATETFYTQVMGFTVGPRPPFPFPGLWLYNGDHGSYNNAVVHVVGIDPKDPEGLRQYLGDRDPGNLSSGTGSLDHIAFAAIGLAEMRGKLKRLEVPFREREVPSLGLRQLFLDDPSGVVIELNYPAAEAL